MKSNINFINLGLTEYSEVLQLQKKLVELRIGDKIEDTVIIVEHPHVFTVGRKFSSQSNILEKGDVPVVEVERGGDVTYHGPGQLVFYPIIKLDEFEHDLDFYLRKLERITSNVLKKWGIQGHTIKNQTGVWVGERKIASIGIAVKKWVTYHGVAININTDLDYFLKIKPCGFDGKVMTSFKDITHREFKFDQIIYWIIKECEVEFSGKARFISIDDLMKEIVEKS